MSTDMPNITSLQGDPTLNELIKHAQQPPNRIHLAQMYAVSKDLEILAQKFSPDARVVLTLAERTKNLQQRFMVFPIRQPVVKLPPAMGPGRLDLNGDAFVAIGEVALPGMDGYAYGAFYGEFRDCQATLKEAEERCRELGRGHWRNHWVAVPMYVA